MSALRLVKTHEQEREQDLVSFCGHCGKQPKTESDAASRVCNDCGLGLILQATADVAPGPKDSFLVIDQTLSVCAMSAAAEQLLDVDETEAVNRHVADFLVPAAAEEKSANLLALLVDAAGSEGEPRTTFVRPAHEFGVRFKARVAACGPPHAALLVLE